MLSLVTFFCVEIQFQKHVEFYARSRNSEVDCCTQIFGKGEFGSMVGKYSGFQMSVYSFENKKSVPLRVLSFHFAVGKMKTAIR